MPGKSRVLLATTCRWFSAARLGISLERAGWVVEAVCPSHHPLGLTSAVSRFHPFRSFTATRSLRRAIEKSAPDLVIPCDDVAAKHLRSLQREAASDPSCEGQTLHELLVRSLGDPASYPILESRGKFMALAKEEGIRTPDTSEVTDAAQVVAWCETHALPAVLKADGTSGGQGVRMARTPDEAVIAFQKLQAPTGLMVALKRAVIDRDLNLIVPWLKRQTHAVTIQNFVHGQDFNISVACWKGEVLATVGAEVLETWRPNGPASVIRFQANGPMFEIAQAMIRRLQLSGLCGFDFLVDRETGEFTLLEINPRSTQTGHLPLGPNHDLPNALLSELTGEKREPIPVTSNGMIALFPLAWQSIPPASHLHCAYHDIPREAPELVRAGEAETRLLLRSKWVQWIQLWANAWLPFGLYRFGWRG